MSYKALKAFATALAAAAIATVTGTASAKFVGSEFDPIFFVGFGQFLVPDTPSPCQYLGTGFFAVNGANSCTGVLLLDVTVNASDGANSAVLSLPPPTPDANAVTGMVLDPNSGSLVVGMDTGLIPISCTGALCAGDDWFIQWNSGLSVGNPSLSGLAQTVKLWRDTCNDGCLEEFPADQVFFTPEPGSLALLFGALGAGWIARRRKNTA